nr:DNA internalization-related competence protein ComEC/Rec2 [Thioalkalivibrio sp. ALJ7]
MKGFTLGLLLVAWWLHRQSELPQLTASHVVALALTGLFILAAARHLKLPIRVFVATAAGALLAWALVFVTAGTWLKQVVKPSLAGEEIVVSATVTSLPEHLEHRSRFRITVDAVLSGPEDVSARDLLVTAYPGRPEIVAGTRARMALRLRPAAGRSNPGGFDRAGWYYREGLHGSGTLLEWTPLKEAVPLSTTIRWRARLHHGRGWLRDRMERAAPSLNHPGLIQALVIGDRQGMTSREWQAFLRTGTNHLMAISGLHVGLVAGFVGLLAGGLWSVSRALQGVARKAAFMALAGLFGAVIYAAMAGFSIPTQRAVIMLGAFMAALLWRREAFAWRGLMLAAIAVVVWQPASVLAPGFWFSFGAVTVILLLLQGRTRRPGWREAGTIQVMLALAMLPLSLAWFQLGSWIAPVANLVAVPVISLLVLPVLLVGAGLSALWTPLGAPFLYLGDGVLTMLLVLLERLSALPVLVDERRVPLAASLLGGLGVLLALQPRLRLGAVWTLLVGLALVLPLRPDIAEGALRAQLLDVGNSQSVLLQTRGHALLFDAGFGRDDGFSAGEQIVVPALRASGLRHLDRMILSHEHAAHAGGAPAVRDAVPVTEVLRRRPETHNERQCRAGQQWEWDGVRFEVLHPPPGWNDQASASCVLAVETAGGVRLVLTGGLSGLGEAILMRRSATIRESDLLVVPRGAGADSLSRGWLDDARPQIAWASTDGQRRGLAESVRQRLVAACIPLQETGVQGALRLEADTELRVTPGNRAQSRRLWHTTVPTTPIPREGCQTGRSAGPP